MYRQWLIDVIKRGKLAGKSQNSLAKHLQMDATAVSRMKQGGRKIQADELPKIAAFYGESLPAQGVGRTIGLKEVELAEVKMRGALEAGLFRSVEDDLEAGLPKSVYVPLASHIGHEHLHAWLVRGDSMNAAGILDGDHVISIDTKATGWTPENGRTVVVERRIDGSEIERTLKKVRVYPDRIEFVPDSTNPKHRPIVVPIETHPEGGLEIEVIGRVIKVVRDTL